MIGRLNSLIIAFLMLPGMYVCHASTGALWSADIVQNNAEPLTEDSLLLTDSVQTILKTVDSLMSDSLSQRVILDATPFIPGKDGLIFPDLNHFIEYPDLYDFNFITNQLSYSEDLKIKYASVKKVDERIHFNLFRYLPQRNGLIVNGFKLSYITYHNMNLAPLWVHHQILSSKDSLPFRLRYVWMDDFVSRDNEVWQKVRDRMNIEYPSFVDLHWNQLPDPPMISDTTYLPLVNGVRLDYKEFSGEERDYVRKISGFNQPKSPWTLKGYMSIQGNETFIEHWAKGGESSISVLGIGGFEADYKTANLKWENDVELKLGAFKQFDDGDKVRKNDDRLKISSKVGYKAFDNWYYSANFDLQTQLFDGYNLNKDAPDPISAFLSPARTYLALGMDYKYKKSLLSVFISPLTMKHTLVADGRISEKKYGVEEGKKSKTEAGAYIKGALKWNVSPDMLVQSKLYLFSNYVNNPQNVDMDWEGVFDYKFSHVFSLRFSLNLKYDDDEAIYLGKDDAGTKLYTKKLQVKQLMSVGLSYRF